jgi:hypothetical protein
VLDPLRWPACPARSLASPNTASSSVPGESGRETSAARADRVRQNHYAGSVPSGKSFYFEYEDALVVYSIPANRIAQGLLGKPNAVLELARLWAPDGHRPNLLTEAISASVRWVREREPTCEAVISYADSAAVAAGHDGGVYRAASWAPLAASPGNQSFRNTRTGRLVGRRSFRRPISPCGAPRGPPGKKLGRARGPISMRTGEH